MEINNKNKKTVLFIEDDLMLARLCRAKFERENIGLEIAADGKAAMDLLEKDPPDAVILDLMLPAVSGFEVLKAMRKNEKWKNVPVLILSNLGGAQDVERGLALGANEYLVKARTGLDEIVQKVKALFLNQ